MTWSFPLPTNSLPLSKRFLFKPVSLTAWWENWHLQLLVVIRHWFASSPPHHTIVAFTAVFMFQITALFCTFLNGRLLHFNNCQSVGHPHSGQTSFHHADKKVVNRLFEIVVWICFITLVFFVLSLWFHFILNGFILLLLTSESLTVQAWEQEHSCSAVSACLFLHYLLRLSFKHSHFEVLAVGSDSFCPAYLLVIHRVHRKALSYL